jgi:ribonuclease BN (tRNA processing enzyme)
MKALLLGSGGWIPTSRRETCTAYLRDGDSVLLLDAGSGVRRLVEDPGLLDGVERFDIVLTHFHLDHVVGLAYLPALPVEPVLWGAGQRLNSVRTIAILERLLGSPLFGARPAELAAAVREIPDGEFEAGAWTIGSRVQRLHTDPTLALRIGDLTYCTDTAADPENVAFARGSRVLCHEAWYASASTEDGTHSAAGEAGEIANEAEVDKLVLIHVNPLQSSDDALLAPASDAFGAATVGEDLAPLANGVWS